MIVELSVLGGSGDIKITWDKSDPESIAKARAEVKRLREAGYLFFIVDGSPADEITAGNGELHARFATEEELLEPAPTEPETQEMPEPEAPKKRGRKPKVNVIAVPPLRGG